MRLSRIFQCKNLIRLTANLAGENQVKKLFGHLQHVRAVSHTGSWQGG